MIDDSNIHFCNRRSNAGLFLIFLLGLSMPEAWCQKTVFSILKSETEEADVFFSKGNYRQALLLYLKNEAGNKPERNICLKIARSYYGLREYNNAVLWYERQLRNSALTPDDMFRYAEALCALKKYDEAVDWYEKVQATDPNNEIALSKIWRLRNIGYLYEDSIYHDVRETGINSLYAEFSPALLDDELIFVSNRKPTKLVERVDAATGMSFYRIYSSKVTADTLKGDSIFQYTAPQLFCKELEARFHEGSIVLYDSGRKMVYTASNPEVREKRTLQLFFAEKTGDIWRISEQFPHNSNEYSLSAPAITKDGKVLFFVSDMKGGFGGTDIYRSVKEGGTWSEPVNLGPMFNTYCDEAFPYIFRDNTLYFSSCGHPGLGGMDIFKIEFHGDEFTEIENMTYPINTNYDEFSIAFDSTGASGFFSSNRKNGGLDDDIYWFKSGFQAYPLTIRGSIKFREASVRDTALLQRLPDATLLLIDVTRDVIVDKGVSDSTGRFSMTVPYFGKYAMRVTDRDGIETVVSLNIPKYSQLNSHYQVVVIKDALRRKDEDPVTRVNDSN